MRKLDAKIAALNLKDAKPPPPPEPGRAFFVGDDKCTSCHKGGKFTDEAFHNTGVAWVPDNSAAGGRLADRGRGGVTKRPEDEGAFRTPTLREVSRTAPYMHNGSLPTLEAVVDFYEPGGRANPNLDPDLMPLQLTAADKTALVAFLNALDGSNR